MIYADFYSILVPVNSQKQNPDKSYTNKYQKHAPCSFGYKLPCADDTFSKLFWNRISKELASLCSSGNFACSEGVLNL